MTTEHPPPEPPPSDQPAPDQPVPDQPVPDQPTSGDVPSADVEAADDGPRTTPPPIPGELLDMLDRARFRVVDVLEDELSRHFLLNDSVIVVRFCIATKASFQFFLIYHSSPTP